jgi:hypothetical protein
METKEIVFWTLSCVVLIAIWLWPAVELPKGRWVYTKKELDEDAAGAKEPAPKYPQ